MAKSLCFSHNKLTHTHTHSHASNDVTWVSVIWVLRLQVWKFEVWKKVWQCCRSAMLNLWKTKERKQINGFHKKLNYWLSQPMYQTSNNNIHFELSIHDTVCESDTVPNIRSILNNSLQLLKAFPTLFCRFWSTWRNSNCTDWKDREWKECIGKHHPKSKGF